ncbi:hypothetical protein EC957_006775 [Mortierella hygrophila]|uniref:DUF5648 domain-containing protein n=1 Tax=Mortierella hygrophila TaxID=979708 RepID=A0A9P6JYY0_9FUNG|nr:hypothetical protein EC957_006775 [Mortierella hygrophila]
MMVTGADHYYTTDPKDMSASGYSFEGITGYLYPVKFAHTIALHHWFNPTLGDNFYTVNEPHLPTPGDGYDYKGIVGYIYQKATRGTAPLLRWYHSIGDHFYTTNSRGIICHNALQH